MFRPLLRFLSRAFSLEAVLTFSILLVVFYAVGIHVGKQEARKNSPVDQALAAVTELETGNTNSTNLQHAAINGLLKATGDRWANYFPKESASLLDQSLQGLYSGVGLWLRNPDNKNNTPPEISGVQPNSPAAKAGIRPLDKLLNINGQSTVGLSLAQELAMLRGEPGTRVELQLSRKIGNEKSQYRISLLRSQLENSQIGTSQITSKILYIQIAAFAEGEANEIQSALAHYSHPDGVILDLRNNPGGLISQAVDIASVFMGKGKIVTYSIKGQPTQTLMAENPNPDKSALMVLVNKATASSAEVLASALQENNRALVVGERTFGKGVIQEITTLSDGSQIVLTVGKYLTAKGHNLNGVGLIPDLTTSDQLSLKKSIAILTGLHNLSSKEINKSKTNAKSIKK